MGEERSRRVGIVLLVMVIGILIVMVAPHFMRKSESALREAANTTINGEIALALDLYEGDNGSYPAKLEDLVARPASLTTWKGPYLKKVLPLDPWGSPYVYRIPGVHNSDSYDLHSIGKDKQDSTADDIVNWKKA